MRLPRFTLDAPNRRAAENGDEFAPSKSSAHIPPLPWVAPGRIARPRPRSGSRWRVISSRS